MAGEPQGVTAEAGRFASTALDISGPPSVRIELSSAQVDRVVRDASGDGTILVLLSGLEEVRERLEGAREADDDGRLSRSLLSGLLLLARFPADGSYVSNSMVAARNGMKISTAHRYISTLVVVGLLERDPVTRRYRVVGRLGREAGASVGSPHTELCEDADHRDGRGETLAVVLSEAQVQQVVQQAAGAGAMSLLLSGRTGVWGPPHARPEKLTDLRLSRSLLSGLRMLSVFPTDGGYLRNADVARELNVNPSTTHRYLATLAAAGLLERHPQTHQYRLAQWAYGLTR
jgi:DNA-binding IclR family transcriptional regulator